MIRLCLTPNGITRQFGSASALSEGDANHSEDGCVSAEQLPWTGAPLREVLRGRAALPAPQGVNSIRRPEVFHEMRVDRLFCKEVVKDGTPFMIRQTWVGYLHATANPIRLSPATMETN